MSTVVFVNAYEFDYLGTRVLASYLQQNNISVHCILLDNNKDILINNPKNKFIGYQIYSSALIEHKAMHQPLTKEDWEALGQALAMEQPQIIGFSARSTHNFLIEHIVSIFKESVPNALLAAGGFGPTLEPDLYLAGGFDVVVRGDGEEALLELAQCLERNDRANMLRIANTSWSVAHGGQVNPLSDQLKNLSSTPLSGDMYFTWIQDGRLHRYEDPMLHSNYYRTFLGRGCPGKCTYCSGGQWKGIYRQENKKAYVRRNRAIEDVIEECRQLPDSVNFILFSDEYWSLSKEKAEKFFRLYKKYVHKPFYAYLAYEQMIRNPDLLNLAIDAGLSNTGIGFQTGSEHLLRQCYERQAQYPILLAYAQRLFNNFVTFSAQFIGGNCYESWKDLEQTLTLIRSLPVSFEYPDSVCISNIRLRPHPGSPIIKSSPRVVTDPMPALEWYFRAILMRFCRFFTLEEFSAITNTFMSRIAQNGANIEDINLLEKNFKNMLFDKQRNHYQRIVQNSNNESWIYYGAGDLYTRNRDFFAPLRPQAILVDREYMPPIANKNNIPIIAVEDFFRNENTKNNNIMVFLGAPQEVKRKLLRQYKVPFEKIHSCSQIL